MFLNGIYFVQRLDRIYDFEGNFLEVVFYVQKFIKIKFDRFVVEFVMLRKKIES